MAHEKVHQFITNTSVHALPHVLHVGNTTCRVFWFLIFLLGLGFLGNHSFQQIAMFLEYRHQVKIEYRANGSLEFPAVTFCALNPIKKSLAACDADLKDMIDIEEVGTAAVCEYVEKGNWSVFFPTEAIYTCSEDGVKRKVRNKKVDITKFCAGGFLSDPSILLGAVINYSAVTNAYKQNEKKKLFPIPTDENPSTTMDSFYEEGNDSEDYRSEDAIMSNAINALYRYENVYEGFVDQSVVADLSDIMNLVTLPETKIVKYGFELRELLLSCSIDGRSCMNESFFLKTYNPSYGSCFTFNSALDTSHHKTTITRKRGTKSGLRLVFNIQADEYIGLLADQYGMRVSIHPPDLMPIPDEDGFNIPTGTKTSIGLVLHETTRLEAPFSSNCVRNEYPAQYRYMLSNSSKINYSLRYCQVLCRRHYVEQKCGCRLSLHRLLHIEEEWEAKEDDKRCSILSSQQRKCIRSVDNALNSKRKGGIDCDCRQPCLEKEFKRSLAQSSWPTRSFQRLKFHHFFGKDELTNQLLSLPELPPENFKWRDSDSLDIERLRSTWKIDGQAELERNVANLHVYFEELEFHFYREEETYPLSSLFADIGGIMGLYLGISICTILEFLQLIVMLLGAPCHRREDNAIENMEDMVEIEKNMENRNEIEKSLENTDETKEKLENEKEN